MIVFPPYRLDVAEQRLWKGDKLLALRRKPFAILHYLASRPGRLVTHDELLAEVWAGAVVSESAVRSHLHELRQVLHDGVIETVVGRGYRFVAALAAPASAAAKAAPPAPAHVASARPERLVVGRAAELATLRAAFERAAAGRRQVCIVSGEPGIGKTTLIDTFVDELEDRGVLAVTGHCVEQFGTPEAYLAMIEAIGKLMRAEQGDRILATFVRHAATFLATLPQLVPDAMAAEVARRAQGGTEARMMRELAEAIEAACDPDPIVIVLEDLQWSDLATIDALSMLGQRGERAKLLVVGTSRPQAIHAADHPLSRVAKNLVARFGATSIALDRIEVGALRELLARRFPDHAFPARLEDVLASTTGGTPLFLVTLIEDLVGRGMVAERDGRWQLTVEVDDIAAYRPASIRQLIDIQLDRLGTDDQRVLEAASLVGAVFETDRVAAALGISVEAVDDRCDELARRGLFLRRESSAEAPDGAFLSRYAVTHALVQEVCEDRGSPVRRQRWHLAIAEHLERAYAGRATDIAHVLALHFEKAGQASRAIAHYVAAGHQTALRFASGDAVTFLERARGLLARVPRTRVRDELELSMLATIGQLWFRTPYGMGDPLGVYERSLEIAREIGDAANEYAALANLALRRAIYAELDLAVALGDELVAMEGRHALDPVLVEYGTNVRAFAAAYRGDMAVAARLFESLLDDSRRAGATGGVIHPTAMLGAVVRTALSRSYGALAQCYLGAPDRAVREAQQAIEEARELDDPIALGITEGMLVRIRFLRNDPPELAAADAGVVLCRATAGWVVMDEARLIQRWASCGASPMSTDEATAAVAAYRARLARSSLGAPSVAPPTAAALWISGHRAQAREVVELAIAYALAHGELLCVPELLVLRGDHAEDAATRAAAYREAHARAVALGLPLLEERATARLAQT